MNLERRINRLNRRFGEAFGYSILGPKYRWAYTPDMPYWLKDGSATTQLPSGLYVPAPTYKRRTWAEIHGVCYMLSVYKLPVSESEFHSRYGATAPWPSKGEYQLIENVKLHSGPPPEEPDDDLTDMAIWAVRRDLEKSFTTFKEEGDKIVRDQMAESKRLIEDEFDDCVPAYHPGVRGQSRLIFTEKAEKI